MPSGASSSVQYAVLGLISARHDGIHGYRLKRELDDRLGDYWAVNAGCMYRLLGRLERAGLIAGAEVPQVGRPPRRVYRITPLGTKCLEGWLRRPPEEGPPARRDEVAVKLLFRGEGGRRDVVDLLRRQRALYLRELSRLRKRRTRFGSSADGFVSALVLLQPEMRVRSDLAWLEVVEREIEQRARAGELGCASRPAAGSTERHFAPADREPDEDPRCRARPRASRGAPEGVRPGGRTP